MASCKPRMNPMNSPPPLLSSFLLFVTITIKRKQEACSTGSSTSESAQPVSDRPVARFLSAVCRPVRNDAAHLLVPYDDIKSPNYRADVIF